jgi:signal transduction histidine kinase
MRRPSRSQLQRFADIAIPWGMTIFLLLVVLGENPGKESSLEFFAGAALAIVQGAALHWRRRRPELVVAVTLPCAAAFQLLFPDTVVPFAALFAVASLAAARPPRVSLLGLAGLEAVVVLDFFTARVEDAAFTMAVAVGAWALGEASRNRRAAIQEEARRAVGEEQARIARELHDVIAHSVSVIVVQAGAAGDVFDERPDQARAALGSIEEAGRDALGELRRLISAVRPGQAEDPTQPQPGLDRLDELTERVRGGGLEVVVRREGRPEPLPAGVDLSAYRIVQEALTNTLRHARATRAEVVVRFGPDAVEVDVSDDGRAAPASEENGGGVGILGMRERASLLGGTLEAGPLPAGGYRVHARLPLEQAR